MIPLWLDLSGHKVVVFGGGAVGRRKANYLASEADVTVVSRDFLPGFEPSIRLEQEDIEGSLSRWVSWADLVVAATDDQELNKSIVDVATVQGKLSNSADGPSTFLIPSVIERDRYKVAVSTEGRSPAMSKYLRMQLERALDPCYDRMVELQEELREQVKASVPSQKEREERLWNVLEDQHIWDLLESDPEEARKLALKRVVA